jgi:hypothetical protein
MKRPKPSSRMPFEKWSTLGSKLTAGQRAVYRIVGDKLEPNQLEGAEAEKAAIIFGNVDTIPAEARRVFAQVKGRGIGGTRFGAELAALIGATIDLAGAGIDRSELAYVWMGGPKLRHARPALRFAKTVLQHHGATIEDESADGFTLVRPDGYRVRFEAFAPSRGGDNVRGVHIVAALLTEAGFYYDDTGVNCGEGVFSAMMPRLLKGGMVIIESSPWLEGSGILWREFTQNYGEPKRAIAALCPTATMRDDAETLAMVAAEYERDKEAAERELGAQFVGGGAGHFFGPDLLAPAVIRDLPLVKYNPGGRIAIGGDFGLVSDASTFCSIHSHGGALTVLDGLEMRPKKGAPLKLSEVVRTGCEFAGRYGAKQIHVDHHELIAAREHLRGGVTLKPCRGGQDAKTDRFLRVREAFRMGKIRIPGTLSKLSNQLSMIVSKPLPGGGTSIVLPRRAGTHMDLASAFVLAVDEVTRRRSRMFDALCGRRDDDDWTTPLYPKGALQ